MADAAKPSGGNNDYYVLDIKQPKRLAPYQAECEDIIEALGMTFAEGNVFKALWRSCAARQGNGKAGVDAVYDGDKIAYYGERVKAQRRQHSKEGFSVALDRFKVMGKAHVEDAVNKAKERDAAAQKLREHLMGNSQLSKMVEDTNARLSESIREGLTVFPKYNSLSDPRPVAGENVKYVSPEEVQRAANFLSGMTPK